MSYKNWLSAGAVAILSLSLSSTIAWADDHGEGHGHGHERHDHDRDDHHGRGHAYGHYKHERFDDHDREQMRGWYRTHYRQLPPGWRHNHLPPGWERRVVVQEVVPVDLRPEMHPCPPELVRVLPPPPPNYAHFYIGGNVVLMNQANFQVADVFHLDVNIH